MELALSIMTLLSPWYFSPYLKTPYENRIIFVLFVHILLVNVWQTTYMPIHPRKLRDSSLRSLDHLNISSGTDRSGLTNL